MSHIAQRLRNVANRHVVSLVELGLPHNKELLEQHPPVFVVGPPRCGSTLLMQVLCSSLEIEYLSNRHCRVFGAPGLVSRRQHEDSVNHSFESQHGQTANPEGPAECAGWWYRFFPKNSLHLSPGQLPTSRAQAFSRSVAAMTAPNARPVVFKNLYASLRICAIREAIPTSKFIILNRDESAVASSILAGRVKAMGSYTSWWSLRPPGCEHLDGSDPARDVVLQVRNTYKTIAADLKLAEVPDRDVLTVDYEQVCEDPHRVVDRIAAFTGARKRKESTLPSSFQVRDSSNLPEDIEQRLLHYVQTADI